MSPRGDSAESLDMAMSSSSEIVAKLNRVLSELLLSGETFRSSFGRSAVLSPGIKPGYLRNNTSHKQQRHLWTALDICTPSAMMVPVDRICCGDIRYVAAFTNDALPNMHRQTAR